MPDSRARSTTVASFDGRDWDSYTVRRMPNGSWAVLHRRGAGVGADERARDVVELLAGFPTRAGAWGCAARLARAGFVRGAGCDRRRAHVPRLREEGMRPVVHETAGDPARLGGIVMTARPPAF